MAAALACGPAGSGKTTTIYACLRELVNKSGSQRSLVSLEDPIEAIVPGVAQSQISAASGFDYETGLKSLLRQDPEVIVVGEIRDRNTAETVFQAALTGHLVLTTFHAGSAAEGICRLADLGIEPYFDGRTRILTPIKQFLPMTIEVWVRTSDLHSMFIVGSDLPDKFGIGLQVNRLIVSAEIVSGGVHAPKPIQPNRWCHMAVVFGDSHATLYVNGKPVARGPASKLSGDTPFVIGNLGEDHLSQFYNGQIRSVRISKGERYSTEFAPDDVLQSDKTAVLVYDASSVRGSRVVDLSVKNNHGIIQRLMIESMRANNATTSPQ